MRIEADTHTHTIASTHAYSTVLEMAKSASEAGLKAIAITDHSTGGSDAPHIWHFHNLSRAIPRKLFDVNMIFGVECDIVDFNGNLAFGPSELERLDWVVASIHGNYNMSGGTVDDYTNAYIGVAQNPFVDVIGHPIYPAYKPDYEKVVPVFKEYGKFVEINESAIPRSVKTINNALELIGVCKKHRVPVIVNSDAHFCMSVGKFDNALKMLKDNNYPEELIVNTKWENIKAHIENKKGRIFE